MRRWLICGLLLSAHLLGTGCAGRSRQLSLDRDDRICGLALGSIDDMSATLPACDVATLNEGLLYLVRTAPAPLDRGMQVDLAARVAAFLAAGADPNVCDESGRSAASFAAASHNLFALRLLNAAAERSAASR